MKGQATILLLFLFLFFTSGQLRGQTAQENLEDALQKKLEAIVRDNSLPGATAAIVLPNGHQVSLAAGYADREADIRMEPGARMFSGSVGKTFVAALILKQVETGQLRLEEKLDAYFGEESWYRQLPNASEITVRMLLQHTSGLPRYVFQPAFIQALKDQPDRIWKPEELLGFVANMKHQHPTGKGWAYSDTNYLLLGLLLEKMTGKQYYTLLEEQILKPLGLQHTYPSTQAELPGLTQGYIGSQNVLGLPRNKTVENGRYAINPQFEWTGGGLVTSAEDLAKWMFSLQKGQILSHRMLQEMRLPVAFRSGLPAESGYGLGCFVWQVGEGLHYGHEGLMPGHVTSVEYAADEELAISIQVNTDEGFTSKLHGFALELKAIVKGHLEALEQAAILENFQQQEVCWNQGDIDCYMKAYFPSDSIRTISRQGVTFGYEAIRQQYRANWPPERMGRLHFDQMLLERISADTYSVLGRFNLQLPEREEPARGWFSVLMKRIDNEWYMVSDHSS
ncbi:MAG: serine hydrolase [Phaeodactylibacter sp.]|nr:serine hydrolase [Phaeodactylibacter sp.]